MGRGKGELEESMEDKELKMQEIFEEGEGDKGLKKLK
jgi:hypothetical protein